MVASAAWAPRMRPRLRACASRAPKACSRMAIVGRMLPRSSGPRRLVSCERLLSTPKRPTPCDGPALAAALPKEQPRHRTFEGIGKTVSRIRGGLIDKLAKPGWRTQCDADRGAQRRKVGGLYPKICGVETIAPSRQGALVDEFGDAAAQARLTLILAPPRRTPVGSLTRK